jgi:hypothetical protein
MINIFFGLFVETYRSLVAVTNRGAEIALLMRNKTFSYE